MYLNNIILLPMHVNLLYITQVLQELGWLPVSSYLTFMVGFLAFKCVKGLAPSYLSDHFVTCSAVRDHNTRNQDFLNIPAYQLGADQCTF